MQWWGSSCNAGATCKQSLYFFLLVNTSHSLFGSGGEKGQTQTSLCLIKEWLVFTERNNHSVEPFGQCAVDSAAPASIKPKQIPEDCGYHCSSLDFCSDFPSSSSGFELDQSYEIHTIPWWLYFLVSLLEFHSIYWKFILNIPKLKLKGVYNYSWKILRYFKKVTRRPGVGHTKSFGLSLPKQPQAGPGITRSQSTPGRTVCQST